MKRFTAIILAFLLAILLPFTTSAATGHDFQQYLISLEDHVQSGQLAESIKAGQLDGWALISLARDNVLTQENKNSSLKLLAGRTELTGQNLEKTIIGVKALGQDPSRFNHQDLTAKLANGTSLKGIYDAIYGLIALTGSKVPADAVNTPDKLIDTILKLAAPAPNGGNGSGWGFDPATPDVDTTGAALAALAPYQSESKVSEAIHHAVDYLAGVESADGGFSNYGENSNTTAEAVIGLTAVGINPATDSRFNKNGKNPLNYLYSYKKQDGDYYWSNSYPGDPVVSNDEVLKAYVAYKVFLSGGKLFVFPAATAATPTPVVTAPKKPAAQQPSSTKPASKPTATAGKATEKSTRAAHSAAPVAAGTTHTTTTPKKTHPVAVAAGTSESKPAAAETAASENAPVTANKTVAKSGAPATQEKVKANNKQRHHDTKHNGSKQSASKPAASGSEKNTPKTKAVQSTAVNPFILISGIVVIVLGAAALIFRKRIWGRNA